MEILAKEYLRSLTEPQEEPDSKEANETKENCVRILRIAKEIQDVVYMICPGVGLMLILWFCLFFRMFRRLQRGNKLHQQST